jgi:TRAP-type mannitol/chloroaromatic compound transport system permease small subunit
VNVLVAFVNLIDRLNERIGRGVAWLTLLMVLITFAVVILRYVYAVGWVWLQESYVWLHGVVFMVGAGYTLLHNGHVRVDIFYRPNSVRYKAVVDLFGSLLLLLPLVVIVVYVSYDYVIDSWMRLEQSREAGGLPGLFLLKSVILVFCLLIGLQGLSLAARSFLVLMGHPEFQPQEEETGPI